MGDINDWMLYAMPVWRSTAAISMMLLVEFASSLSLVFLLSLAYLLILASFALGVLKEILLVKVNKDWIKYGSLDCGSFGSRQFWITAVLDFISFGTWQC